MDIVPYTISGFFDALLIPIRGIIQPIVDGYRKQQPATVTVELPPWAVSDIQNTPIPHTVNHRYDFGNGGVYGPPDNPVRAGIVNVPGTVNVQKVHPTTDMTLVPEFYNGPQDNMELFVYSPFSLPTNLPCSTSMLKY